MIAILETVSAQGHALGYPASTTTEGHEVCGPHEATHGRVVIASYWNEQYMELLKLRMKSFESSFCLLLYDNQHLAGKVLKVDLSTLLIVAN